MYNPVAASQLSGVCTPSQAKPIAKARTDAAMRIFGLERPKSAGQRNVGSVNISTAINKSYSRWTVRERVLEGGAKAYFTSIAPNDQKDDDLYSEADSVRQEHDTVDRPLAPQEKQGLRISSGLV